MVRKTICAKNLPTYYIDRHVSWFWTMKNILLTCPIGNFWGCLAQKVYEGCWETKREQQLIRRIECKMKEFDAHFVESLLEGVIFNFNFCTLTYVTPVIQAFSPSATQLLFDTFFPNYCQYNLTSVPVPTLPKHFVLSLNLARFL